MRKLLNSYTHYFNVKHKRKGPLWVGEFQNTHIETDEQLLHFTRYVHLNPVTAYLVDRPEDWKASSYKEYLSESPDGDKICDFRNLLGIEKTSYKTFMDDRIAYQQDLAKIKKLLLD